MAELIFKIVPRTEWEQVKTPYRGSTHDRADGFLHFSTWMQLPETLNRYYVDQTDLLLVAVDQAKLGADLKWEYAPSCDEDFPHLYGAIDLKAVVWVKPIAKSTDGDFILPG